ncbi:hypothetical protein [Streptococcus equi]|uniref:hypothetical protein n=1 Tax=Streptococcus equi TaxID=1336 RepID=UPI001E52EE92|nr:hypothetical protein [Streptococcus equi]MCD3485050.1 hypothetical protein [Streptococcus equi subsp. equi]
MPRPFKLAYQRKAFFKKSSDIKKTLKNLTKAKDKVRLSSSLTLYQTDKLMKSLIGSLPKKEKRNKKETRQKKKKLKKKEKKKKKKRKRKKEKKQKPRKRRKKFWNRKKKIRKRNDRKI